VAILKKGELVATGDVNEILANEDIVEIGAANLPALQLSVEQFSGYTSMKVEDNLIQLFYPIGTINLEGINRHFFNEGIVLNHLQLKRKSLESKFMELTN
jgi:ABC-2 type transport system ATP-binding protein